MKRLLAAACFLFSAFAFSQTATVNSLTATTANITTATVGTNALVTVSDDFAGGDSDSLGNDSNGNSWVEAAGDTDIASNKAAQQTAAGDCVNVCGTSFSGVTRYVRANDGDDVGQYPELIVRYTDASSPYYSVRFDSVVGQITWLRYASVGGASVTNQQTAGAVYSAGAPITWAVTIIGTGDDTIVRVWKDPVNNTPAAVDGWDSGGDTADWSFTDNPASPVNTGPKAGFGGYQTLANTLEWDDFYAGDL